MTNTIQLALRAVLPLCALAAVACSSGGTTTTTTGGATAETATSLSLTESCSGKYLCTVDGTSQSVPTVLSIQNGACYAGKVELTKDGMAISGGAEPVRGTWSGTSSAFDICEDHTCIHCKSQSGSGAAAPASGGGSGSSCHGTPDSCSGGAGSCSSTRGCSLHTHYTYSNGAVSGTEYECLGSPESCDSFSEEQGCKRQGCEWN